MERVSGPLSQTAASDLRQSSGLVPPFGANGRARGSLKAVSAADTATQRCGILCTPADIHAISPGTPDGTRMPELMKRAELRGSVGRTITEQPTTATDKPGPDVDTFLSYAVGEVPGPPSELSVCSHSGTTSQRRDSVESRPVGLQTLRPLVPRSTRRHCLVLLHWPETTGMSPPRGLCEVRWPGH